jgi:hypothetical protein
MRIAGVESSTPEDERSHRHGSGRHRGPHPDHGTDAILRHSGGEHGERQGADRCSTDPLHGSGGDQEADRGGERRGGGADGEDGGAAEVQPLASEAVPQRTDGEGERRTSDHVGHQHPLQLRRRGVEVALDAGKGDRGDAGVQAHQELAGGERRHHRSSVASAAVRVGDRRPGSRYRWG